MKETKPPDPPPVKVTYCFPPPATPAAASEGPSQDAAKVGEVVVFVETDGRTHALILTHNFNLSAGEVTDLRLPDVSYEAEDVDFYDQRPVIEKRNANSITITLNPVDHTFSGAKPTKFTIKLKRYYRPVPPPEVPRAS